MSGANVTLGTKLNLAATLKGVEQMRRLLLAFSERFVGPDYLGFRRSGFTLGFISSSPLATKIEI